MNKKQLAEQSAQEAKLLNELKGSSLFFYPKPADQSGESVPSSAGTDSLHNEVSPSTPDSSSKVDTDAPTTNVRRATGAGDHQAVSSTQATQVSQSPTDIPEVRTVERTTERSNGAPSERPIVRDTTRYSFEFYRDQIEHLRRLSFEDRMHGGKRTMSDIVREAIDRYFESADERTTERSNERTEHRSTR